MKFTLRLIKHICILLLVCIPLQLLGAILLGIYLPIQRRLVQTNPERSWKLPYLLRWFDNADMYVNRDTTTYLQVVVPQGVWVQYCWLAWRNPINFFGYKILGVQVVTTRHLYGEGNFTIGDDTMPGYYYQEVDINGKVYYEYYYVHKWSQTKCFRFRMGYKLGMKNLKAGDYIQEVMAIQIFKDYWGQ